MAGEFDAGSILLTLKAQLGDFNKGIADAKATLDDLGASATKAAASIGDSGTAVATAFTRIGEQSATVSRTFNDLEAGTTKVGTAMRGTNVATDATEKTFSRANLTMTRSLNRIIGVQVALLSLSANSNGPLKEAFQGLSNGLAAFSAAMQLTRGQIGLFNASLLALGVAVVSYIARGLEEGIKATDATTTAEIKARLSLTQLADAFSDANKASAAFAQTGLQAAQGKLTTLESLFSSNLKAIRLLPEEISAVGQKLDAEIGKPFYERSSTAIKQYADQVAALRYQLEQLEARNKDIENQAIFAKADVEAKKLGEDLEKSRQALQDIQDVGAKALKLGLEDPATAANANLAEAKKRLDEILEDQLKFARLAATPGLTDAQRGQFLGRVNSGDVAAAADAFKAALENKKAIDATNELAKDFSAAVGNGLKDAILNAKTPMAALATIGQNLFENMIDQLVKRLQTGLTDAFKAISGAAGEGIGLAITGILGAAGAVLSRLGGSGSDSFASVTSPVTSSQAVRGIVAGPSSVAIATVGDNLSRALSPVVDKLTGILTKLGQIETNTRGGRGGASSNVTVATA